MSEFKMTMLGTSRSGKTCYLHAMHFVLGGRGRNGFNLICQNDDDAVRMMAAYRAMRDEGRAPDRTNLGDFAVYQFAFTYGYEPLIRFDWVDYRGDALVDGASATDRQALRAHLLASSAVLLCISGEYLQKPIDEDDADDLADQIGATGMSGFLKELREARNIGTNELFPVIVLITKADLCIHRAQQELVADVKTLLPTLFKEDDTGWHVMICPVMLGRNIGSATELGKGKIKPEYVHWPLIFAIHAQKNREVAASRDEVEEAGRTVEDMKNKNWFQRWINDIDDDTIDRAGALHRLAREQMETVARQLDLLASEIKTEEIYINGRRINEISAD